MPNPKLETYKNKATGTVYNYTDAAAQATLAGILDGTDIDSFSDVETALATKVDKVTGKGLSTNDYDDTEKAKVAGAFPRSEQAVLGAKQLLTPNLSGYIPGGLTVTNDNGVLTINGTQASQDNIVLKTRILDGNKYQYLPKGSYTFDCKGSSGSYRVFVGTTYNGSYAEWGAGSSVTFTIDDNTNSDYKLSDGSVLVGFWATIPANTYNNEKLYPLLTVAGDTDRTFAHFAMTNQQLTEKVNKITPTEGLTLATGVTPNSADQYNILRIGDLKILSLMVTGVVVNANTWFELGTLSDEMKPDNVYVGQVSINSKTDVFDCYIQSDKKIRIRNNSNAITSEDIVKVFAVYV